MATIAAGSFHGCKYFRELTAIRSLTLHYRLAMRKDFAMHPVIPDKAKLFEKLTLG
jgi:hypothetical protein